jgi:hypothetical protein
MIQLIIIMVAILITWALTAAALTGAGAALMRLANDGPVTPSDWLA